MRTGGERCRSPRPFCTRSSRPVDVERCHGSTMILAWSSGLPRSMNACGTCVDRHEPGEPAARGRPSPRRSRRATRRTRTGRSRARTGCSARLPMPSIGWIVSCCMQAPTTRTRALRGAIRIACSIIPGTPTASKITSGLFPSTLRHASIACLAAGSTTTSQPSCSASARRFGEKSAADDRADPAHLQSAMQARPTGPSPITIARLAAGDLRLFATACTPTASGSVSAAMRPAGRSAP